MASPVLRFEIRRRIMDMRNKEQIKEAISAGRAVLGIEFGSTRIKAVLIDEDKSPVASGSYDWENQYVDHI